MRSEKTDPALGRRGSLLLLLGLAVICVAVVLLCLAYVNALSRSMQEETERYLEEVTEHVRSTVDDRLESDLRGLNAAAETCALLPEAAIASYLDTLKGYYRYSNMGTIDRDGHYCGSDGSEDEIAPSDDLSRAWSGRPQILAERGQEGGRYLAYLVPMYRNGRAVALLAAGSPEEDMRGYLSVESFSGRGYSAVVDRSGGFISITDQPGARQNAANLFDLLETEGTLEGAVTLEQLQADLAEGRSGVCYYTLGDGVRKVLNYQPLESVDWYLLSVLPTSVTQEQSAPLVAQAVGLAVIIVCLFLGLVVLILRLSRESHRRLERIAYVDPVTGGASLTRFRMEAMKAIRAAPGGTFALVSLDIHKFKLINDSFTSREGDLTLRYVYQTISACLREGEMAARVAADTYNLLLRYDGQEGLSVRLEEMAQRVNAFNETKREKYFLPLSMGVYRVDDPALDFITIQDRATVARKKYRRMEGRERLSACAFYTEAERRRLLWEKEIDDRMDAAMAAGEFVVYLQPKVSLALDRVVGAEALVRWIDPERGTIPPDEFIPVMERTGAVTRLDLYVFEQVCRLLRRWREEGRRSLPVAVNLSRAHLEDPQFLEPYREILERWQVSAGMIEVELTETILLEDPAMVADAIDKLHAMGFRCALDDFGSGYSSLNALKDVPADVLKLDRAFFSGEPGNVRSQQVVASVIELAARLEMQTVAEGVERPEQVDFLRGAGCDMVQGYVFSRPLPVEEFEAFAFSEGPVKSAR